MDGPACSTANEPAPTESEDPQTVEHRKDAVARYLGSRHLLGGASAGSAPTAFSAVAASITDLSFPSFMCPSVARAVGAPFQTPAPAPDITTSVGSAVARAVAASRAGQAFETQGLPLQAAAEFDAAVAALSLMLAVAPPQVLVALTPKVAEYRSRAQQLRELAAPAYAPAPGPAPGPVPGPIHSKISRWMSALAQPTSSPPPPPPDHAQTQPAAVSVVLGFVVRVLPREPCATAGAPKKNARPNLCGVVGGAGTSSDRGAAGAAGAGAGVGAGTAATAAAAAAAGAGPTATAAAAAAGCRACPNAAAATAALRGKVARLETHAARLATGLVARVAAEAAEAAASRARTTSTWAARGAAHSDARAPARGAAAALAALLTPQALLPPTPLPNARWPPPKPAAAASEGAALPAPKPTARLPFFVNPAAGQRGWNTDGDLRPKTALGGAAALAAAKASVRRVAAKAAAAKAAADNSGGAPSDLGHALVVAAGADAAADAAADASRDGSRTPSAAAGGGSKRRRGDASSAAAATAKKRAHCWTLSAPAVPQPALGSGYLPGGDTFAALLESHGYSGEHGYSGYSGGSGNVLGNAIGEHGGGSNYGSSGHGGSSRSDCDGSNNRRRSSSVSYSSIPSGYGSSSGGGGGFGAPAYGTWSPHVAAHFQAQPAPSHQSAAAWLPALLAQQQNAAAAAAVAAASAAAGGSFGHTGNPGESSGYIGGGGSYSGSDYSSGSSSGNPSAAASAQALAAHQHGPLDLPLGKGRNPGGSGYSGGSFDISGVHRGGGFCSSGGFRGGGLPAQELAAPRAAAMDHAGSRSASTSAQDHEALASADADACAAMLEMAQMSAFAAPAAAPP